MLLFYANAKVVNGPLVLRFMELGEHEARPTETLLKSRSQQVRPNQSFRTSHPECAQSTRAAGPSLPRMQQVCGRDPRVGIDGHVAAIRFIHCPGILLEDD